jgi:hypothetical protein
MTEIKCVKTIEGTIEMKKYYALKDDNLIIDEVEFLETVEENNDFEFIGEFKSRAEAEKYQENK